MPFFLRKIRKAKWYKNDNVPWLAPGEMQADALGDLQTAANALSVWHVEDNKSNLDQVVIAIAVTAQHVSNLDYALFDQQFLSGFRVRAADTETGALGDHAKAWHRDLIELSARKLMELAKIVLDKSEKIRIPEKKLLEAIRKAVTEKQIDPAKLPEGIKAKVVSK